MGRTCQDSDLLQLATCTRTSSQDMVLALGLLFQTPCETNWPFQPVSMDPILPYLAIVKSKVVCHLGLQAFRIHVGELAGIGLTYYTGEGLQKPPMHKCHGKSPVGDGRRGQ